MVDLCHHSINLFSPSQSCIFSIEEFIYYFPQSVGTLEEITYTWSHHVSPPTACSMRKPQRSGDEYQKRYN